MSLDWNVHLLSERTPTHAQLLLIADVSLRAKGKKKQMEPSKGIQVGVSPEKPLLSIITVWTQSPPPVLCKLSSRQDTRIDAWQGHWAETKGLI